MDSLQPLVKHRFWICCGLALILVPLGWWLGTSSLKKESETRKAEIEAADKGIPDGKGHENEKWTQALQQRNAKRAAHYDRHAGELRDMQKKTMTWPVSIASAMADAKKFGDPGSNPNALTFYRTDYYKYMKEEVWKAVDPIRPDPNTKKPIGRVLFNFGGGSNGSSAGGSTPEGGGLTGGGLAGGGLAGGGLTGGGLTGGGLTGGGLAGGGLAGGGLTGGGLAGGGLTGGGLAGGGLAGGGQGAAGTGSLPLVPFSVWEARDPSWEEVWRAQEDAWILKMILQSINRVNDHKKAKTIHEASIRQIILIALRGGSPPGSSESESGSGEETEAGGPQEAGQGPGSGYRSGRQGGGFSPGSVGSPEEGAGGAGAAGAGGDILPYTTADQDDDFGKQVPVSSETGTSDGGEDEEPAEGGGAPMGLSGSSANGSVAFGSGQAGGEMSPYVENDPTKSFKTRGFVLKVLMKRKDIPLLVQELTNVARTGYPVRILRIQEASRNLDLKGLAILQRYEQGGAAGESGFSSGGTIPEGGESGEGGLSNPAFGGGAAGGAIGGDLSGGLPGGIADPGASGAGTSPYRPFGEGEAEGGFEGHDSSVSFQNALNDAGMGYVLISGLVTIYQKPVEEGAENGDDESTTSSQPPPADVEEPSTDGKKPAADGKKPPADVKKPAADGKKPPADVKKPAADKQPPPLPVKGSNPTSQSPTDKKPVPPAIRNGGTTGAPKKK
ncbi:MAG: hypothetical protein ACE5KM_05495 [Planctomycetaceae bacterium]